MAITNGYATLAQVKSALRITDTVDDALIELAIEAASREIDAYCARVFYSMGTASRFFSATDPYFCPIDDLTEITELATALTSNGNYDTVWANPSTGQNNGDYQLEPLNATAPTDGILQPYTGIRALWRYLFPTIGGNALVRVTGTWGWASVPTPIKQAAVIQSTRIFKRNDSPLGVAGFGDMGVMRISSQLDPDVRQLIEPYKLARNFA
jgi:Phage gp6-like head-tail connector protein